MDYTITKDMTVTKIKAAVKAEITAKVIAFLQSEYGEDAVRMVRTGKSTKVDEIAVITDMAIDGEETNPIVVTINPSVKEFSHRKTERKVYEPFDFIKFANDYDAWQASQAVKAEQTAKVNAEKRAKDEAARAAAKAAKAAKADTDF